MELYIRKFKKPLFFIALAAVASWGILHPEIVSAFSISDLFKKVSAEVVETFAPNSQNMWLPTPARNNNPSPSQGGGDITLVAGSALLAQDGPDGTTADIVDKPTSSQISVYTVHQGDTLSQIAEMFDVTVNTIVWANDIKGGVIREGQELVILPITGVRYTVKSGDTLASVAKKYKADIEEVAQYNNLTEDSSLAVGVVIIIPDGEVASPVPVRATATAPLRGAGGASLSGYYVWPVAGGVVTQGLHGYNGIDIGARSGTAVYASAAGTVIVARSGGYNGGYGSYVVIQHDNGTQTLYAHLSSVSVASGTRVAQGTTLGGVGSTGKSTGSHLHFEVRGAANPFR